jgi:hypothetical protein
MTFSMMLGALLLGLCFAGVFAFMVKMEGWKTTILVWAGTLVGLVIISTAVLLLSGTITF